MTDRGAIAALRSALLLALLPVALGGCAVLRGDAKPRPPVGHAAAVEGMAPAVPAVEDSRAPTLGIDVDIVAPGDLAALLRRHLDVLRLGKTVGPGQGDIDDTEWARLIDATPAQVRELLQTEGYFTPTVEVQRTPAATAGAAEGVRLQVDPGPRATVTRVTLTAQGELEKGAAAGEAHAARTLKDLEGGWALPSGSSFRNADWNSAKSTALARLRAAGYANAVWSGTSAEVDAEGNAVRLFLVADSGPLFRYGELQIEGLAVHDSTTLLNLANARAGTPVTEALLLDFQERLQKSGLFENVSVTLDTDPVGADAARITARVREAPLQAYTFGVGISANTGPRASVEHNWRRVFGRAASSRNKFEIGDKRSFWEGELSTHTQPGLVRWLVGGTVENLESTTDTVLSARVRLGRAQDTQRIERLFFVEAERSRRTLADAGRERTNAQALSFNFQGGWRALDSIVLPTIGFTFTGQAGVGVSSGTNAERGPYQRLYGRATGYLPFGRNFFGQARLELGRVFLRDDMVVPESQKWRAGGDDSVRGYGFRRLGPLVDGVVGSGNVLATASVEIARPIIESLPSVWGAVFVDAGNAADSFGNLKPALGFGAGVRWRSPVGPLKIDYAWGQENRAGRVHFSLGIAF